MGGLPFDLSEGDIITIFSQFGEPVYVNLVRDKDTGKSRGFAFLKYEDQRSTDLAVDNLGGATVLGRVLRVDHTRYKPKDDETITDQPGNGETGERKDDPGGVDGNWPRRRQRKGADDSASDEAEEIEKNRPMLPEEKELLRLMHEHDDDDPMKEYLIKEKKEAVDEAILKLRSKDTKKRKGVEKDKSSGHRHHHRYRHHHQDKVDSDEQHAHDGRRHHERDRRSRLRSASHEPMVEGREGRQIPKQQQHYSGSSGSRSRERSRRIPSAERNADHRRPSRDLRDSGGYQKDDHDRVRRRYDDDDRRRRRMYDR